MKLTERHAIEKSIELWTWLAETGNRKGDWDGWGEWKGELQKHCFLCEYSLQEGGGYPGCLHCPYYAKYDERCFPKFGSPYLEWENARSEHDKKKYAKLFLNELKALLDDKETVTVEVELDAEVLKTIKSLHKITDAILEGLDPEDKEKLEA